MCQTSDDHCTCQTLVCGISVCVQVTVESFQKSYWTGGTALFLVLIQHYLIFASSASVMITGTVLLEKHQCKSIKIMREKHLFTYYLSFLFLLINQKQRQSNIMLTKSAVSMTVIK